MTEKPTKRIVLEYIGGTWKCRLEGDLFSVRDIRLCSSQIRATINQWGRLYRLRRKMIERKEKDASGTE